MKHSKGLSERGIREIVRFQSDDLPKINLGLVEKDIFSAEKSIESGTDFKQVLEQLSLCCNDKALIHPQWSLLAGRIQMEIIHSEVPGLFSEATIKMKTILDNQYNKFVSENARKLDEIIRRTNDFNFDIFAVSTLRKSYLAHLKVDENSYLIETPQYMYLRVATYLHYPDMRSIEETYSALSNGDYSHATPTLFNAGMRKPQLSSCFLATVDDEMQSITKSWHDQAIISMNSGGIGYDYNQIRHSEIGQHGFSRGIIPWLKITNEVLKTVDQGGKRKGSGTVYLRDWHMDIYEFVELRDEGPEDMRAKDLFLGIMVSDLFMKRVETDETWSLFCPNKVKGMTEKWGTDFEMTYIAAEQAGLFSRQVRARELWQHIIKMQIKKGMPFMLYMDACNRKSNQKHSGTIRNSNLCTEILEVTNKNEIASCTLASLCLNRCVEYNSQIGRSYFNFDKLERLTKELVRNLNNVIDRNFYPSDIPEIKFSNMKHRPIGIGVQGLADAFALLDIPWIVPNSKQTRPEPEDRFVVNPRAKKLNDQIFETIYFAAVKESVELSKKEGPYPAFEGSPASQGLFQSDLWEEERFEKNIPDIYDPETFETKRKRRSVSSRRKSRYTDDQWEALRQEMITSGMRNSLLVALMPTASSAHILGNMEAMEPFTELIYARTVLSGQFLIVNKHLVRDLEELDLWNTQTVKSIISARGSLSQLRSQNDLQTERLDFLKLKYATVFEIPQKVIMDLSIDRAENICQTQSLNCHMARPTKKKLTAYHFHAWKNGAKTGMYYLRQKALTDPINFSLDTIVVPEKKRVKPSNVVCTDEICTSCNA